MKRCLPVIFLMMYCSLVRGQQTIGLPQITNYSKTDYHGGTQTWDILQDNNGILYFANNEGLVTFDGAYWKVNPLPNRTIMRSIAMDNNRIYAGGQGEIGFFMADANGFLRYESLTGLLPKSEKIFADIWEIKVLGQSVFFRATDRIFELKNNTIQVYFPKSEWQFMTVAGNKLLAQDKKNGLLSYTHNEWIPVKGNKALDHELVAGVIAIGDDSLLISTARKRLFLLHNDSIRLSKVLTGEGSKNSFIYRIARLNSNEFVAGTTSEGCQVMDLSGKIIQQISMTEGLQNNNVLCVFLDRDNNLWAGLNNGISLIAYNAAIKYIRPNKINEVAGFSAKIFNGDLYIGSSDGAYYVPVSANDKDLSFSKGGFSLIKNSSGQVWRLDEVNQRLLMGHTAGTFVIENNTASPLSSQASWLFVPVNPVFPSKNILAGTYTGLKMLEFEDNRFTDKGDLKGVYESLRYLAIDNNNSIWASHPYRGIYKLELAADQKSYTAQLFTDKDGLPSSLNNQVFKIKNRIVFATEKGVYEYDEHTKKFVHSAFLSPVFGNMELRYLNEDGEGNIWFCSGKRIGVVHYSGQSFTITFFPELTGQILSGFENIYPYNSENIFVGSEKGVIHLNYKKYITSKINLSVSLSNVKITGSKDSTIFGGYFPLSGLNSSRMDDIPLQQFPKSYNSFHFEYGSPAYGLQGNMEFSYLLQGYDKDWSGWSSKHEKDYTNLPDGKYTFLIKARNNLGNESPVHHYSFIILPPFYKTGWAYLGYLILGCSLLYLIQRWQKRSLHLQKIKYEEKQKQIIALHNLAIEKNEKEIIKLQNEKLANEVLLKNRELADASMHLVEREDALIKVRAELQKLYKKTGDSHDVKAALKLVSGIENNNSTWDQFASHFDEINNDFLKKLKSGFPNLTNSDLKVCAYLQLNLSSKEIAQLMNISIRGVETIRYRLRKKLQLQNDQSLTDFFNNAV
jgi:ligand-binding sensor domain-containing protein/DNA-binding CsgD family transcriptional regulator